MYVRAVTYVGDQPGTYHVRTYVPAMSDFIAMFQRKRPAVVHVDRRPSKRQYLLQSQNVEATIAHGQRVLDFMHQQYGKEKTEAVLSGMILDMWPSRRQGLGMGSIVIDVDACSLNAEGGAHKVKVEWGFWRKFLEDEMHVRFDARQRQRFYRALKFVVLKRAGGAKSLSSLRGERQRNSCRGNGGALNGRKGCGLGHALLQYFVDHIQRLCTRSDSELLMKEARRLRGYLVEQGYDEKYLPKLIGNPGAQCFFRWRRMYGIQMRSSWMKYKVSFRKIKKRIKVYLGNVFRLRRLWELSFPKGTPMRWLSIDQKPSWFNNAGHTGTFGQRGRHLPTVKENHAKTRERYTILTSVASYPMSETESWKTPQKVAVLFKAKEKGTVYKRLKDSVEPWMKVQTQENGSYRSCDVVEALEWLLPKAEKPEDSIVVVLDWYSGHLTDEVMSCVRERGHVLIFHGGGCTPFTQVNDTHLHANVQRFITQYENQLAHEERKRLLSEGSNKMPDLSREDILGLVRAVWCRLDHAEAARKGYLQTGPTLPMSGPVPHDGVFKDLRNVLEAIAKDEDRAWDPLYVDMGIRDEAVKFVNDGWMKHWNGWNADSINALIEDHTGREEELVEGQEAFNVEVVPEDEDEDEGPETEDDEDDNFGGSGPFNSGGGGGSAARDRGGTGAADGDGAGAGEGCADAAALPVCDQPNGAAPSVAGGCCPPGAAAASAHAMDLMTAKRMVYDEAIRKGDDAMAARIRKYLREDKVAEQDASSEIGTLLRNRAEKEVAAVLEQRRKNKEKQKEEAARAEASAIQKADAQARAHEAKMHLLKQMNENKQYEQVIKRHELFRKTHQRWLQLEYAVELAEKCMEPMNVLSSDAKKGWAREIEHLSKNSFFSSRVSVPFLWEPNPAWLHTCGHTLPFDGTRTKTPVKCGFPFQQFIAPLFAPDRFGCVDPAELPRGLFGRCVPKPEHIFKDYNSIARMLHTNGYVLEKTFVHGIICLSKWLGRDRFPQGVFDKWPPVLPMHLRPSLDEAEVPPPEVLSEAEEAEVPEL